MLNFNSNNRLFQFVSASFLSVCVCVCYHFADFSIRWEKASSVARIVLRLFSKFVLFVGAYECVVCVHLNWDWVVVMFHAITAIETRCHTIATAAQSAFSTKNRLQWFKLLVFDALLCNCTPKILITSLPFKIRAIYCITVREIASAFSILFFIYRNRICCQPHA